MRLIELQQKILLIRLDGQRSFLNGKQTKERVFTDTYAHLSLQELKDMLNENIDSIYAMIDSLSEEELFKPHMRKWADEATKTAVWEVYKFIHVNTVAPFGTFRTKIRKWKKMAL